MSNNLKHTYEAMFLVDSAVATANWDKVIATIKNIMERAKAEIITINKWDERRLAYDVAGRKRGTYILCYFKAAPTMINGIERNVQLDESLLRILILQADHMSEEVIMALTPAMQREAADRKAANESAKTQVSPDNQPGPTEVALAKPENGTKAELENVTKAEPENGTKVEPEHKTKVETTETEPEVESAETQPPASKDAEEAEETEVEKEI